METWKREFISGYVTAALWASTDDNGRALDDSYGWEDISPETMKQMESDCLDFMESNSMDLDDYIKEFSMEQAGIDFWLTRNGHGVGFWDRGLKELGERLSKASKVYGGVDLIVGDDSLIY